MPRDIKRAGFDWNSVGHFLLVKVKALHAPAAKLLAMRVSPPTRRLIDGGGWSAKAGKWSLESVASGMFIARN